ncbi:MAG: response regulator [Sphingobacteriaceae bacterium]|nr:response regulator [Sphingobacteriaceae bacterium]
MLLKVAGLFLKCALNLTLLLSIFIGTTIAQPKKIHFTYLTSGEGLSSNNVYAITKDRYGFMWFGTDDGLTRFDGLNFVVYRNAPENPKSLRVNEITTLHEDKTGRLWIGTNGGAISLYDRKTNEFINIPGDNSKKGISSKAVSSICSDYLGNIWIATFGGLNILNPNTGEVYKFPVNPTNPLALNTSKILKVFEDKLRNIWIGSSSGLYLYNRKKNTFTNFSHSSDKPASLSNNTVREIIEDRKGNLWVGTVDGLNLFLPESKTFKRYKYDATGNNNISSGYIYALAADKDGMIWVGTDKGLNIINTESNRIKTFEPDERNKNCLLSNSIRSILIDNHNIHWIGTYQGGVNKYDVNLTSFNIKTSNRFDTKGLKHPVVTAFAPASNGEIFVGTDGGGLQAFNSSTGFFRNINISAAGNNFSNLSILTLLKSRRNELWIGTYKQGIYIYNLSTGSTTHLKKGNTAFNLSQNDIFALYEDSSGNIWIGTNGEGVNIYDPDSKKITKFSNKNNQGTANEISNSNIRDFAEDSRGNIWIATYGAGISVYNKASGTFFRYTNATSNLPGDVVLTLHIDKADNIWAGTQGGGLALLQKGAKRFLPLTEKEGLANNVIHNITEDREGFLWLSSNKGITRFNPKNKSFKNYTHYNGLQSSAFVRGAGYVSETGELYFGGLQGLNYFNPANLKFNKNIPPVVFTDLVISNKSVKPGIENSPLKEDISVTKEIRLQYKQEFSISFVALNYTVSQQNNYAYKLEGYNKEWNYVGSKNIASYTNLDPGEYTFHVKASNNDGVWNEKGSSIKIVIEPPFWRTTYAYAFYVLSAIGLFLYLRDRAITKIKRRFALEQEKQQALQAREHEKKEAERLRELDMLKLKFLTNLSHEFRTPISLIMAPVDSLLSQDNKQSFSQLNIIKRNARRLLNLVNQLLDFRKMEEQELRINRTEGELVSFIWELSDSFVDLAERKKINFTFETHINTFYTTFDADKVERILFNLLSNAFKFTFEGGAVKLELLIDPDNKDNASRLNIKISDSGIGIPAHRQEKIFERFFQEDTSSAILNQGSGIGLSITKEFVSMHGGTISVESIPGQGSTFTVTLPFVPSMPVEEELHTYEITERVEETEEEPVTELMSSKLDIPRVLIVEDNADFRFYLKENLKKDYLIFEASNGKDGWQKALSGHPDLIVSDISMPVMDGIALSTKLKSDKRTCHIPVILLTAMTGEQEQLKGLETGASDYMTKPFNFEILNSRIRNLLALNNTIKNTYKKHIEVQQPQLEIESEDAKFLNSIVQYIEKNLTNPELSVEELSKHARVSRGTLYTRILSITGETPVEYIRSYKLEKAKALLEKSDYTISQVCYMVGYSTPAYFSKAFRAKYNMLPSEYILLTR